MKFLFFLGLLFTTYSISAQGLDEVFDDGGLSEVKNNINFSVSDFVEGFLTIGYERYVGRSSSVGIGFGVFLFNGMNMHANFGFDQYYTYPSINYEGGFMVQFRYRRYLNDHSGLFWQYGIYYNSRYIKNIDYTLLSVPETKIGYRWSFLDRLNVAASVGFGFGFHGVKNNASRSSILNVKSVSWYIPLNVDLAYDF